MGPRGGPESRGRRRLRGVDRLLVSEDILWCVHLGGKATVYPFGTTSLVLSPLGLHITGRHTTTDHQNQGTNGVMESEQTFKSYTSALPLMKACCQVSSTQ